MWGTERKIGKSRKEPERGSKKRKEVGNTQVLYWVGGGCGAGVVKSVEKKKSVAGQVAVKYRSETY